MLAKLHHKVNGHTLTLTLTNIHNIHKVSGHALTLTLSNIHKVSGHTLTLNSLKHPQHPHAAG